MIQWCRTLLNPYFQRIIRKTHGSPLTSSHPLDLVVLLRTCVSIWRTCHVLSCNNRNKFQIPNQKMSQGIPIHQIQEQLVLSHSLIHQVLIKVKVIVTEDEESGGESEASLCCCWRSIACTKHWWCIHGFTIFKPSSQLASLFIVKQRSELGALRDVELVFWIVVLLWSLYILFLKSYFHKTSFGFQFSYSRLPG